VPGLVGFVGEFLILVGTFTHGGLTLFAVPLLIALAATGVILGVVYLLHLYQKLMFGPLSNPKNADLQDLNIREILVFVPFVVLIALMGLYPKPFLERIDPTSQAAVAEFNLKRCASIFNANGTGPVLMESVVDKCEDPVARVAGVYGDERPASAAKAAAARVEADAKKATDAKAAEAKAAEAKAADAKAPDAKADAKAPAKPPVRLDGKIEAKARPDAKVPMKRDAKAGGNP
jgi:hypothetical protein